MFPEHLLLRTALDGCFWLLLSHKRHQGIFIYFNVEILISVFSKICDHSTYTQTIVQKILLFFSKYKNDQKGRKFWRQKIRKSDFYKNKNVAKIGEKILVSREEPYGTKNSFKYFVGYNDNDVIRPLCIKLLQMTGC